MWDWCLLGSLEAMSRLFVECRRRYRFQPGVSDYKEETCNHGTINDIFPSPSDWVQNSHSLVPVSWFSVPNLSFEVQKYKETFIYSPIALNRVHRKALLRLFQYTPCISTTIMKKLSDKYYSVRSQISTSFVSFKITVDRSTQDSEWKVRKISQG